MFEFYQHEKYKAPVTGYKSLYGKLSPTHSFMPFPHLFFDPHYFMRRLQMRDKKNRRAAE